MSAAKMILRGKIDVKKIDKAELYAGAKGTYLDLALVEKPGGQYGDDGFIVQQLSKATRERDPERKGPIIGNWQWRKEAGVAAPAAPGPSIAEQEGGDGMPF